MLTINLRPHLIWLLVIAGAAGAEVDPRVFSDYDPQHYPKAFALWGEAGIERIRNHERLAAEHVASSESCEEVSMVGWSEQRSAPPSKLVVFVDCANGERFYVDESDLARPATSQSQLAMPERQALEFCRNAVRGEAKFPSTVEFKTFGSSAWSNQTTGRTVAEIDFEAKNELGAVLPYHAKCYFTPGQKRSIEITER